MIAASAIQTSLFSVKKIANFLTLIGIARRFEYPSVSRSIQVDPAMIDAYDKLLQDL